MAGCIGKNLLVESNFGFSFYYRWSLIAGSRDLCAHAASRSCRLQVYAALSRAGMCGRMVVIINAFVLGAVTMRLAVALSTHIRPQFSTHIRPQFSGAVSVSANRNTKVHFYKMSLATKCSSWLAAMIFQMIRYLPGRIAR